MLKIVHSGYQLIAMHLILMTMDMLSIFLTYGLPTNYGLLTTPAIFWVLPVSNKLYLEYVLNPSKIIQFYWYLHIHTEYVVEIKCPFTKVLPEHPKEAYVAQMLSQCAIYRQVGSPDNIQWINMLPQSWTYQNNHVYVKSITKVCA